MTDKSKNTYLQYIIMQIPIFLVAKMNDEFRNPRKYTYIYLPSPYVFFFKFTWIN